MKDSRTKTQRSFSHFSNLATAILPFTLALDVDFDLLLWSVQAESVLLIERICYYCFVFLISCDGHAFVLHPGGCVGEGLYFAVSVLSEHRMGVGAIRLLSGCGSISGDLAS